MAAALAEQIKTKAPKAAVFALPRGKDEMAAMLRADLATARAAWLHESADDSAERLRREQSDFLQGENDKGEVLDFHGLRHTCGAWYIDAGASPKEVQTLMRHQTITLTMDTYGHLFQGQEAETVKKLRPLLNGDKKWQCFGQSSECPDSPNGSPAVVECRNGPTDLEASNPLRYNGFDVDRRRLSPNDADCRETRRVSELASGLTRNQVPRKGLWVRIPCPPL